MGKWENIFVFAWLSFKSIVKINFKNLSKSGNVACVGWWYRQKIIIIFFFWGRDFTRTLLYNVIIEPCETTTSCKSELILSAT